MILSVKLDKKLPPTKKIPSVINRGILQVGIIAQRHSRTHNSSAITPKNAKMPKWVIAYIFGI
jgi:hypothetical protein